MPAQQLGDDMALGHAMLPAVAFELMLQFGSETHGNGHGRDRADDERARSRKCITILHAPRRLGKETRRAAGVIA